MVSFFFQYIQTFFFRICLVRNVTQPSLKKQRYFFLESAGIEEYKDLASELKIIIHVGENVNIVNLLGACTIKGDLNVVLEFCPHGSLYHFLRNRRDMFRAEWCKDEPDMEKELTLIDLMTISHQVAKGMNYLQSRKVSENGVVGFLEFFRFIFLICSGEVISLQQNTLLSSLST